MQKLLRFSSDALPERDRVAVWTELFSRYVLGVQHQPIGDERFSQHATLRRLDDMSLALMSCSPFRASRTGTLLADGNDNLNLIINLSGTMDYRQLGRETVVGPHEGVLISGAEHCVGGATGASRTLMIGVPRQRIAGVLADPEARLCRTLPASEPMRLILSYVQSADKFTFESPGLAEAFATHLQELMLLAIGATQHGEEAARGHGLRAARLVAIKLDIKRLLGRSDLSIAALAQRHRVTTRHIQKLFESEGTTFTEYVIEQRLGEARRMLADQRFAGSSIGDVAFKVGFGDLPHFTRSFRRRFGMTPSEAREQACRDSPDGGNTAV
jgi:AraC-like DNA-binding protein